MLSVPPSILYVSAISCRLTRARIAPSNVQKNNVVVYASHAATWQHDNPPGNRSQ